MYYFLRYGRYLTADELGMLEDDEDAVKKEEPSLEDFKGHIDHYEGLHDDLKGMEHSKCWQKWFRVDLKPFKTAFLNAIKRWSMTFKKHLLERVVNNLADLNSFIERADEGLMQQVKE